MRTRRRLCEPECRRPSRKPESRRRGLTGVYPCGGQSPLCHSATGQSRDFGPSFSPAIRLPYLVPKWAYIGNREMSDKLRNE